MWDPAGLASKASEEDLAWYRAAELKHGRVCMLAAVGCLVQGVWQLPDPVFSNAKAVDAAAQVIMLLVLLFRLLMLLAMAIPSHLLHVGTAMPFVTLVLRADISPCWY